MNSSIEQIKSSKRLNIAMIAAVSSDGFIGLNGKLPWHIPSDLEFFKKHTLDTFVIMGRKTYESIGRPLPNRINIVITSKYKTFIAPGCIVVKDLVSALRSCLQNSRVFVCGGAEIYKQFMPLADELIINNIESKCGGDTKFPEIRSEDWHMWNCQHFKAENEPAQTRKYYIRSNID